MDTKGNYSLVISSDGFEPVTKNFEVLTLNDYCNPECNEFYKSWVKCPAVCDGNCCTQSQPKTLNLLAIILLALLIVL